MFNFFQHLELWRDTICVMILEIKISKFIFPKVSGVIRDILLDEATKKGYECGYVVMLS